MSKNYSNKWEELFMQPADEYMPVPWWAWAGKIEPEQIERQLKQMHEQGIREFFIFPIYGMEVEYMSDEYLGRISLTLEWCRKLGMKAWIYDEYTWPSGTAGGLVARKHPYAIACNLWLEVYENADCSKVDELKNDRSIVHATELDGKVVAYRRKKDNNANLTVKGALWTRQDPGMLDILSKSAVRAFIDEAYEPIAERFPEHLGTTIKGFFTDEPSIAPGSVAWTDDLPAYFERKFGYDIIPVLHDLNFDSKTSERTRRDYWQAVSEMAADAYIGQLAEWCEKHNMQLTGHLVYEENSYGVWYLGDLPSSLKLMHVPGSDLLDNCTNFDIPEFWYEFGGSSIIKAPKNPASSARFNHRSRVMCECFGVMPWTKTMADEKRMADWLSALGINFFNDNSLISNIHGFRKRGIAGKHFTQPWWPNAKLSYDYIGRISALSANSILDTDLVVMYPTTTWWSMAVRGEKIPAELRMLEKALDTTMDALVRKHWDFEFLYEYLLDNARVVDGYLLTGSSWFRGIVIAGIARLKPEHIAKLMRFANAGGGIFIVGDPPLSTDGVPVRFPGAVYLPDWESESFKDELDKALDACVERPWKVVNKGAEGIISSARSGSDGRKYLFVSNITFGRKSVEVSWDKGNEIELWDAGSGHRWLPEQADAMISLTLNEGDSILLVYSAGVGDVDNKPAAHFVNAANYGPGLELAGEWRFSIDRLNLYKLEQKIKPDIDGVYDAASSEIVSDEGWTDVVAEDSGVSLGSDHMKYYWVKSTFTLENNINNLQIVGDSNDMERVYVNGIDLGESSDFELWDDENRVWDVGDAARVGDNIVLVKVKASPYNAEPLVCFPSTFTEPVVVMGSFAATADGRLSELTDVVNIGDWCSQGFPHFIGTAVYEKSFIWENDESDVVIKLDTGKDLVEVTLDGVILGKKAWGLRAFNAHLTPGKHLIQIKISNTLGPIILRSYAGWKPYPVPPAGLLAPVEIMGVR